jgi:hypothetical protein
MMQSTVGLLWASCREFLGGVTQAGNCVLELRRIGIVDVDAVVARGKLGRERVSPNSRRCTAAESCQRNCAPVPHWMLTLSSPLSREVFVVDEWKLL